MRCEGNAWKQPEVQSRNLGRLGDCPGGGSLQFAIGNSIALFASVRTIYGRPDLLRHDWVAITCFTNGQKVDI